MNKSHVSPRLIHGIVFILTRAQDPVINTRTMLKNSLFMKSHRSGVQERLPASSVPAQVGTTIQAINANGQRLSCGRESRTGCV